MGIESQTRTYEPVKVRFRPGSIVRQTDRWTGRIIPDEKVTESHFFLDAELELRGLKQGFEVLGRIRQTRFDAKKLEAKIKAALVNGLPQRVVIDMFKITELIVDPDSPELDAWEADSTLDDIHSPHLGAQAKAGNEAVDTWKAAIEDACDALRDGYAYNRDKLRDAISFIEWCHGAANNGMMHSWCEEKLARIRGNLSKLATYKNLNHPNAIHAADDTVGLLRSWPVVNSWHGQPPKRPGTTPR